MLLKFCSSWNDPVYLQISDAFVFVDVSPLSLLKYTLFLSIPFHPLFFISALQTRHYLRSMEMWKEFWGGFAGFINLHKYAFMYCFLTGYSTPAVYKQHCQADIFLFSLFFFYKWDLKRGKWKPVCAIYIWAQGFVCASVFLFFFSCRSKHTHTHTLDLSTACRRGDKRWLLIVMVFAPLIYPAHAGYLAGPDCVDGDTSILSLGGEARRWSAHNEGDVINQHCAQQQKKQNAVSHLHELVSLLIGITQWRFSFLATPVSQSEVCSSFFSCFDIKGDFKIKEFTLNGASTLCRRCLSSMVVSTCNILLINGSRKEDATGWHQVVPVILSLLCALCPLAALCHLFWCSNLSQVNNILCCLKLCVGNKKGGLVLLLKVPVCDFSLAAAPWHSNVQIK